MAGSDNLRVFNENAPAPSVGPDAPIITGSGMSLPPGVPANLSPAGMVLVPGGTPMNLPSGAVVSMGTSGNVTITLPQSSGSGTGDASNGLLASNGAGLSAVTITPTGIVTGRDASGLPIAVDGGIAGNPALKALLDQIADMLPEEYRKKWGLKSKSASAGDGVKVSGLY